MTDTKLTDFSEKQLRLYWMVIESGKRHPGITYTEKEQADIDLLITQILNAATIVKQRENVNSN